MEAGKVYEAPAGWHWGSRAEVAAIMGGGRRERQPQKIYYYGQGKWDEYTCWGGVTRYNFVFSDSLTAGGYLHAGCVEGQIRELAGGDPAVALTKYFFAGIVCVANW